MAYNEPSPGTLKRKRRRRADKPSISAKLQLDNTLQGDLAVVSADLADDLCLSSGDDEEIFHLAISAWVPSSTSSNYKYARWTVLPCRRASGHASYNSQIRLSLASANAPALLRTLRSSPADHQGRPNSVIEVRVADISPLALETVYVSVDYDALRKLDHVHSQYSGGFISKRTNGRLGSRSRERRKEQNQTTRKEWSDKRQEILQAVQEALKNVRIAHIGDSVPLPLPTHPVTHAPAPPVTIVGCEPVSQGSVTANTRIVVLPEGGSDGRTKSAAVQTRKPFQAQAALTEMDEETSNEAFYTAAEDGHMPSSPEKNDSSSDSENSSTDLDLSDDADDMISLTSPSLGSQASGMMSTLTAATPRPLGRQTNGINTPGSVYSTMTSATLRGGQGTRTKVLKAQGLLERISDDILHPRPLGHDDEEARVYVDTNVLAKIGCFSGDWVELEKAVDPATAGLAGLGMHLFAEPSAQQGQPLRAVKVFGLPESLTPKPARYQLGNRSGRRDSISSVQTTLVSTLTPTIYLSPILLANLGEPTHLRIAPLRPLEVNALGRGRNKISPSSAPPIAKEVSFLKLLTPLSTERQLDPSLFAGVRDYFEQKQRVVMSGDLIAIPFDVALGTAVFDGRPSDDAVEDNDLLSQLSSAQVQASTGQDSSTMGVAWFEISDVVAPTRDDNEEPDVWHGLVSVDPSRTRMGQSGTDQKRLPLATGNAWQYYQGLSKLPPTTEDSGGVLRSLPVPRVSQLQRRLRELISAATSPRATYLGLPPIAILITSTQRNIGKAYTATQACTDLGMHCFPIDAYDILTEAASGGGDIKTEGFLKSRAERALQCGAQHTAVLIRHLEALNSDRMSSAIKEVLTDSRVLVATTTEIDKIPDTLRGLFTHELEMSAPDEGEREGILNSIVANTSIPISPSVDLSSVAVKTAALVAGDLLDVVDRAIAAQANRLEALASSASLASNTSVTVRDIQISGGDSATALTAADFDHAVDDARKNFADAIGAPKIPNVQWSDVGGLANVKEAVIETIQLPLARPELFAKGLKKRSGILFYGPPGTGKTLLAKAIATEFSLNFFSVKGPELLNMYIGESEANVRRVFQRARDARPCCVFFDELDSVAPKRGNQGDSGGVMDRIVSQLLAELDGMSDGDEGGSGGGVFVIGATNRPDLLDQALLRPGRFDKMLYLGVSDTHDKQLKILEALTRKFALDPELQLRRVAESLPFTYTGADLYALCSDAMLKAITRSARLVDDRVAAINAGRVAEQPAKATITIAQFFDHHSTDDDTRVVVAEEDFLAAQRELVPSVSAEEIGHYERVRQEFEGAKDKDKEKEKAKEQPKLPTTMPDLDEVERFQQRMIEQIMNQGFSDGSLARNDPGGKGKGRGGMGMQNRRVEKRPQNEEDDDLVVRTDHLALNGSRNGENEKGAVNGMSKGKGKGKGKMAVQERETGEGTFGDAAADEDLYA